MANKITAEDLLDSYFMAKEYVINKSDVWLFVSRLYMDKPELKQGWKLHVSCRPSNFEQAIKKTIPVLLHYKCDFKIALDTNVLRLINSGIYGIATIGKAMTIYANQDTFVDMANSLSDALAGMEGPQISSDRIVKKNSPVYYRYGPFLPNQQIDNWGESDIVLTSPDGKIVSGLAGNSFYLPEWLEDPLDGRNNNYAQMPLIGNRALIGDYYTISGAIVHTPKGSIYRAIDIRNGENVVIKEAKAYVNEYSKRDARTYLQNEINILSKLDDVPQIPKIRDYFVYGNNAFLVTTEIGKYNLRDFVIDFGVFGCNKKSNRNIFDLAADILETLDIIHKKGIIYRDLAPKNLVLLSSGKWSLVDFELSYTGKACLYGWSLGYSHSEQRQKKKPTIKIDYYALGMTLFYALTGMDPVVVENTQKKNAKKTIECLSEVIGKNNPMVNIIEDLLSSDIELQINAIKRLHESREKYITRNNINRAETNLCVSDADLNRIFNHTLNQVLKKSETLLNSDIVNEFPISKFNTYDGLAGVALELSLHPEGKPMADYLCEIFSANIYGSNLPSSLMFGKMGIIICIEQISPSSDDTATILNALYENEVGIQGRIDFTHGLAGIGIGYLILSDIPKFDKMATQLADKCVEQLFYNQSKIKNHLGRLPTSKIKHGISIKDGFAHGKAGVAYFLLAHALKTDNPDSKQQSYEYFCELCQIVNKLAYWSKSNSARPMAASWCQGLSGIGSALIRSAVYFNEKIFFDAAILAAESCVSVAPRIPLVTQCCGLAGVGEFLLDMYSFTHDLKFRKNTLNILNLILLRSRGTINKPYFPDPNNSDNSIGWATGSSGMLSLLRRFVNHNSQRFWMYGDDILKKNNCEKKL